MSTATEQRTIYVADNGVSLTDVLGDLGIHFGRIPGQIRCPVHKGGLEGTPSARIYPDSRIFCYTCGTQYGPTDVYAAAMEITKEQAAETLLEKFPLEPGVKDQLLREFHLPKTPPVLTAYQNLFEDILLRYRHRVPLEVYRKQAVMLEKLPELLGGQSSDQQADKFRFLNDNLRATLDAHVGGTGT